MMGPGTERKAESGAAKGGRFGRVARVVLITAAIAGAALAVGALSFFLAFRAERRSNELAVPDLKGLTQEEAELVLQRDGLTLVVTQERFDRAVASGRILDQEPAAGS